MRDQKSQLDVDGNRMENVTYPYFPYSDQYVDSIRKKYRSIAEAAEQRAADVLELNKTLESGLQYRATMCEELKAFGEKQIELAKEANKRLEDSQ